MVSSTFSSIEIKQVCPTSVDWQRFIALSVDYIQETWPEALNGKTRDEFLTEYEALLLERFADRGRGLFIFNNNDNIFGLANVYITDIECTHPTKNLRILNVAEFTILPKFRKMKLGSYCFQLLLSWGRRHAAHKVHVEVDKPMHNANLFWAKQGLTLDYSGNRNLYYGDIQPLRIYWIRHGKVKLPQNLDFYPLDEELGLDDSSVFEAKKLAPYFQSSFPIPIFVSPLRRAKETAEVIANEVPGANLDIHMISGLEEFFPKELIGMKFSKIEEVYGSDYEIRLRNEPLNNHFKKSEPLVEAGQRVMKVIMQLAQLDLPTNYRVVISHGLLHNIFLLKILSGDLNKIYRIEIDNLAYSTFDFDFSNSVFKVISINQKLGENLLQ